MASTTTPKDYLLSTSPRFKTQTDLVRALRETEEFRGRELNSMRAYFNQVLKPGSVKTSRPFSPSLRRAVIEVFRNEFPNDEQLTEWTLGLDASFAEHKKVDMEVVSVDLRWDQLRDEAENAITQFIVTWNPAEIKDSSYAISLKRMLAKKLELIDKGPSEENAYKYVFCLNKKSLATTFWSSLRTFLITEYNLSEDEVNANLIRAFESGRLLTYICSDQFCAIPFVLINPEQGFDNSSGYIMFAVDDKDNGIDISKMDRRSKIFLLENHYRNVTNGKKKYQLFLAKEFLLN